jgi:hypothetical protein
MDTQLAPRSVDDGAGLPPPRVAAPAVGRWWRGRYRAPLLREVAIIVVLLLVYRLGRTLGREE